MLSQQIVSFARTKYKVIAASLLMTILSIWAISNAFSKPETKSPFKTSVLKMKFPKKSVERPLQMGACGIIQ